MTEITLVPPKRLTSWQRLRRWLIIRLAGTMPVMVNALVEDGVVRMQGPAFMHRCHLENTIPDMIGLQLYANTPIKMTKNYLGVRVSFTGGDMSGVDFDIPKGV